MCICQNVQNKNRSKNMSDIVNQMLQYGPLNSKTDKKHEKKKVAQGKRGSAQQTRTCVKLPPFDTQGSRESNNQRVLLR
jgi:hypothetical protein